MNDDTISRQAAQRWGARGMNDLCNNAEGYTDMTAALAIRAAEGDEMDIEAWDIVRYVGAEPPERLTVEEGHTDTVKEPERGTDDLKALAEALTLRAERDVYKRLYDDLLKRIAGA